MKHVPLCCHLFGWDSCGGRGGSEKASGVVFVVQVVDDFSIFGFLYRGTDNTTKLIMINLKIWYSLSDHGEKLQCTPMKPAAGYGCF